MARFWILQIVSILVISAVNCCQQESGTLVPLYIYPKTDSGGNAWQKLFDAYNAHPIKTWAIVNVYNGPGENKAEPNYAKGIRDLHSAGINTLGYVYTRYGGRSSSEVKADIARWKRLYKPNGIFLDEMAYDDNATLVKYYKDLNKYAKSQGFNFTVGNPGTRTSARYFDTVDNIVIYETDKGFPSKDLICSQDTNKRGRNSVSILSYNIPNLDTAAVNNVKPCAGLIYVTDDSGDNPWDTLPNYLSQLFQTLSG